MRKRAGSWLALCLVIVGGLGAASCTGTPPLFDTVILNLSAFKVGPNQKVTIIATVPQDKTDAGVTWIFTPEAGVLNPGTFTSTPAQAIYTSPASVTSQFTVTIQATSIALPNETRTVTITITPPQALEITTTTLPNGVANTTYPTTQLKATGGVTPYTWSLVNGTTLPNGLSLAADGTISGEPIVTGTFKFTVQVSDNEATPMKKTANLSIAVTNLLNGNYVFEFSGFNATGAVAIAGSFTADGLGNLTAGVEDFNSTSGKPINQMFTGTFTLGNDNRGSLTFKSLSGPPVFDFAIDSTGSHGRIIEFDSSGIQGSGRLEKQTVSSCVYNTISGNYAFGIVGQEVASGVTQAGPAVIVGSFSATPPVAAGSAGSIGPGEADSNTPGLVTQGDGSLSGTFQTTAQSTRCELSFSNVNANIGAMTFSAYPVSSSEVFLVETDTVNSATAPFLTIGRMLIQTGAPFGVAGSTFTATSAAGLTGQFLSGANYVPDLALVYLTGSSGPTYSISILENQAGTVAQFSGSGVTFQSADQYGRIVGGFVSPIDPVFYIVGDNEAFCIGEILNDPFFGLLEPQSPIPFDITASDLNSTFVMGTSFPATAAVRDLSGVVTLANTSTTAGNVNGTQDQSASGGNTPGQAVTGTYSGLSSTTGAGALALTAPLPAVSGDFLVVSPTKVIVLTTTTGDTDPVLIFLGNCAGTCNED